VVHQVQPHKQESPGGGPGLCWRLDGYRGRRSAFLNSVF
jgi:hypothetical protein